MSKNFIIAAFLAELAALQGVAINEDNASADVSGYLRQNLLQRPFSSS
jgi:hypothetical protein